MRISLNVADLSRAKAFYRDALGFAPASEEAADPKWIRLLAGEEGLRARTARLRLGGEELDLVAFDPPGAEYPRDSTSADLWFQHFAIVTHDLAAACRGLKRHGATPITRGGPQRLPPAAGAVSAYKFRDPEGHPLELIQFPAGSGDAAWQGPAPGLTIGIDHSALSIADAARSLAFYGSLGLSPSSRHVNSGPEQDRLDGLSEVAVEVIGLTPVVVRTPHLELLCYRTPRGCPSAPSRAPRDIADTRLILLVEDLADLVQALASVGTAASPLIELASGSRATLVRDPSGHALVLIEES
jgi:catechol 2,3-dioxygenase-like lactoylglutathione lyase family enzyme